MTPQVEIRLESPIVVNKFQALAKFTGGFLLEFTEFSFALAC